MEQIDIDYIKKDKDVDERVIEVYELLRQYMSAEARSDWIERRRKNWNAIKNEMTEDITKSDMAKKGQEDIIVNKCVEGVEGSAAIITNSKPEIKFLPIGSGDLYVAELMKRAFDQVWESNEATDTAYEVVEEHRIGGHGFFDVDVDRSKDPFGAIVINEEDPTCLYWDVKSRKRDYSDTPIIKAKLRSLQYIKTEYGDKIASDHEIFFSPTDGTQDDSTSTGITGGDNYTEPPDHPVDPEALKKQKNIWEIEAWLIQKRTMHWQFTIDENGYMTSEPLEIEKGKEIEDIVDFANIDEETKLPTLKANKNAFYWKRKVAVRVLRVIVGKKLIEEKTNPHGFDRDGNPIIRTIGYKAQRTLSSYCMSKTDYALPLNIELNKRRAQAMYLVSSQYGGTLVLPFAHTIINKGTPEETIVVGKEAAFQPYRIQPGTIDAQILLQLVQEGKVDIQDVYHTPDVVQGKLPKGYGQIAGKTVLALQDFAGLTSVPETRKFESSMVRLAKIVMHFILRYWPRTKWERLLEDDERLKFAPERTDEHKQLESMENEDQEADEIQRKIQAKWEKALELIRPSDPSKPAGFSLLNIDVKMVTGSSKPTNRMAKLETAIELYGGEQGKGIYDREACLEYIDDPQKDAILGRMKKREELMMQQALQQKLR